MKLWDDDYDDEDDYDDDERDDGLDACARPALPFPHPKHELSGHRIACTVPEYTGATFTCIRHCPGCMTTLMAKVLKDERQMVRLVGTDRRVLGLDLIRQRTDEFDPRRVMFENTLKQVQRDRENTT